MMFLVLVCTFTVIIYFLIINVFLVMECRVNNSVKHFNYKNLFLFYIIFQSVKLELVQIFIYIRLFQLFLYIQYEEEG